jgi:hypothetical protein
MQGKPTTREWDLNRPDAKKLDVPARLGGDDPRCGPSSLQRFAGEDLTVRLACRKSLWCAGCMAPIRAGMQLWCAGMLQGIMHKHVLMSKGTRARLPDQGGQHTSEENEVEPS